LALAATNHNFFKKSEISLNKMRKLAEIFEKNVKNKQKTKIIHIKVTFSTDEAKAKALITELWKNTN